MKHLSKLKLNAIAESCLAEREMNALRGGGQPGDCSCGCCFPDYEWQLVCFDGDQNYESGTHFDGDYPMVVTENGVTTYYGGSLPIIEVTPDP